MASPSQGKGTRVLAVPEAPAHDTRVPSPSVKRTQVRKALQYDESFSDSIARTLSEDVWRSHIRRMATDAGFGRQYHTRFSIGSEPGWPDDWFMSLSQRRMLFIEGKRQNGKLSSDQVDFLNDLARLRDTGFPIEVYVARPLDRDALVKMLFPYAELDGEPLHQWCLSQMCGRCMTDRNDAVTRKGGRRNGSRRRA